MKDLTSILHSGNYSCVISNNGTVRTFTRRGVNDLYDIYLNEPVAGRSMKKRTRRVEALERYIEADDACSACYGSLIYAMDRLNDRGMLGRGTKKVCIGQGFRGKTGDIGVGACTSCFKKTLGGCPPKAKDMLEFLEKNL